MFCEECGTEIKRADFKVRRFCSDKCRSKFHNRSRVKVRRCPICGKDTTTRFCSKICRIEFNKIKPKKDEQEVIE